MGSGPATRDGWGAWPGWLAAAGIATFAWDKPGCGESQGDWRSQTLDDRATEVLAAVAAVRGHPAVGDRPVGLLGGSQGGWVAPLAASRSAEVAAVVAVSGPGVTVAAQERYRIARQAGPEAAAAYDTRLAALDRGDPPRAVWEAEAPLRAEPWWPVLGDATPEELAFLAGIYRYDPVPVLERVTCPLLALWGGQDTYVPVPESVAAFTAAALTAGNDRAVLVVVPAADHGLRTRAGQSWGEAGRPVVVPWLAEVLRA